MHDVCASQLNYITPLSTSNSSLTPKQNMVLYKRLLALAARRAQHFQNCFVVCLRRARLIYRCILAMAYHLFVVFNGMGTIFMLVFHVHPLVVSMRNVCLC